LGLLPGGNRYRVDLLDGACVAVASAAFAGVEVAHDVQSGTLADDVPDLLGALVEGEHREPLRPVGTVYGEREAGDEAPFGRGAHGGIGPCPPGQDDPFLLGNRLRVATLAGSDKRLRERAGRSAVRAVGWIAGAGLESVEQALNG
jgi:hypothetical protein